MKLLSLKIKNKRDESKNQNSSFTNDVDGRLFPARLTVHTVHV